MFLTLLRPREYLSIMLEAREVTYRAGGRSGATASRRRSSRVGCISSSAPNGAGKSTLDQDTSRLLMPANTARATTRARDAASLGEGDLAMCRAVLSQAVEVAFSIAVRELVMMGRYPHFGGAAGVQGRARSATR